MLREALFPSTAQSKTQMIREEGPENSQELYEKWGLEMPPAQSRRVTFVGSRCFWRK
jgi:hypothetical protein